MLARCCHLLPWAHVPTALPQTPTPPPPQRLSSSSSAATSACSTSRKVLPKCILYFTIKYTRYRIHCAYFDQDITLYPVSTVASFARPCKTPSVYFYRVEQKKWRYIERMFLPGCSQPQPAMPGWCLAKQSLFSAEACISKSRRHYQIQFDDPWYEQKMC